MKTRTCRYISILLLISLLCPTAWAGNKKNSKPKEKAPLLSGVGVGIDICGLAMKAVGARFANMEISGRIGLKEKYFPIFEIGIGDCTRYGGETTNVFSTRAPYWRIGMDYNLNKKVNGNRFLLGVRYGFSSYKYDFTCPDFTDPVYGTVRPLQLEGLQGKINGLTDIKVIIDGRLDSSNADVMLDSTFTDFESLKGYAVHPDHVAVADSKVRPYTVQRSCLDFEQD